MSYGDLQFYDIIFFAAIAAFLVFRLRKVLGRRSGFEKHQNENQKKQHDTPEDKNDFEETPELEENILELKKAYSCIKDFNHKNFLDGAKSAFETIINSFNRGDKNTLKKLLNKDVYNIFVKEIDQGNNDPEMQIFFFKY